MSFITKRERVFNEYDLFDLPGRNEGKLKAYSSCTDARAWSHFCSDKTEHLVEIIKRNNDINRPKYVPTNVIVETLTVAKNAEISRLRRKIEEFEQMLTAYDQLDLTCDQKCEIASAHAAIKAANKDLDDMCLDLDFSSITEGIDSEAFETGKSRGDEAAKYRGDEFCCGMETPKMGTKSNQTNPPCDCDASTNAKDPRIDEMQDIIICKDAKLNAMQNTIAVMENDVCEPYCVYAHIYTALEKIFGVLCQNEKYKQYLDLLTAGRDTGSIDIKGKILFKLKVIEKFSLALIAPCSTELTSPEQGATCYRAEIGARIENSFAMTTGESVKPYIENKRAHLVADIMDSEEMKEILGKESDSMRVDDVKTSDFFAIDNYCIDTENLTRLKNLQENYDDLMTCFETLKHERDFLQARCFKYEELEKEFDVLKSQYNEYNALWNEKEHYRKRSADLDTLKEKYVILADETANLETQLKAESEINNIKTNSIDELRNENIALEKKINDANIAFEKEKNVLQCKLQETECTVMCQEQQIKSLSMQINRLLEQDHERINSNEDISQSTYIEIDSLKEQIKNLKETIFCNEEEKQSLQEGFEEKLQLINSLKMEIEDWKSTYQKILQRSEYLERLIDENRILSQDVAEKNTAIQNLINIINNKSQEAQKLMEQVDMKNYETTDLSKRLHDLQEMYNNSLNLLENEKKCSLHSRDLARQESQELLEKIKNYDQIIHKQDDVTKSLEIQVENYKELQQMLSNTIEANTKLQTDLASRENEIQRLRERNNYVLNNINSLQNQKEQCEMSLSLTKKESEIFQESNKQLMIENNRLENELRSKKMELDSTSHSIKVTQKESAELMDKLQKSKNIQDDFNKLTESYHEEINKNKTLQNDLIDKSKEIDNLLMTLNELKLKNEELLQQVQRFTTLEQELSRLEKSYDKLLSDKRELQNNFESSTNQINMLQNSLENKIEENRELSEQIKSLEFLQISANNNIITLQNENLATQAALNTIKKDSTMLLDRLKQHDTLESEYNILKTTHDEVVTENKRLENDLKVQFINLKKMEQENNELNSQNHNILTHNECLEKALITARTECMSKSASPQESYADVIKEINELKKKKLQSQLEIRNLLDKLEESENEISNLDGIVLSRDRKITVMQNHINELEDEIRNLHRNLAEVVGTGEEIKDFSYQKIDQSLKKMEAHHSRATHNMKMELAQLQNENAKLEKQLSDSKLSEENFRDKHKYISVISHLQNEREIIVSDIKKIELNSVGDSALSSDNCSVEDVLTSLDRIKKYCDARCSKSSSLEQTLLKMQTSSQLLLSKADEAKKIVEKEKQKIVNEKEEAVKDRHKMEKQLIDLKLKLENQIALDKDIIEDLRADSQNQKLIMEEINKSTQSYISKLKEEIKCLQNMYQNSIADLSKLEEENQNLNEEKNNNLDIIKKTNLDLEEKSKEIAVLQNHFEQLKNKQQRNFGIQVLAFENNRNMSSQTDNELFYDECESPMECPNQKSMDKITNINKIWTKKSTSEQKIQEFHTKKNVRPVSEVQILSASVAPSFDYIKNSYLNYKLQRLGNSRLTQCSISCFNDSLDINHSHSFTIKKDVSGILTQTPDTMNIETEKIYVDSKIAHTPNLVDVYHQLSLHTIAGHEDNLNVAKSHNMYSQSPIKSSAFTEFELTNESFESENNINGFQNSNTFLDSSEKSTDKDLFFIYQDSEINKTLKTQTTDDKTPWRSNSQTEITVEAVTLYPNIKSKYQKKEFKGTKQMKENRIENELLLYPKDEENNENYIVKHKLDIQLPRVDVGSPSQTSGFDKKSLDSFILEMYSSPRQTNSDIKINGSRTIDHIHKNSAASGYFSNKRNQYLENNNYSDLDSHDHRAKYLENNVKHLIINKLKDTTKISNSEQDSFASKEKRSHTNLEILKTTKLESESHHKLSRVGADFGLIKPEINNELAEIQIKEPSDFALQYILESVQKEVEPNHAKTLNIVKEIRKARSDERFNQLNLKVTTDSSQSRLSPSKMPSDEYKTDSIYSDIKTINKSSNKSYKEQSVLVKMDASENFGNKVHRLTNTLENIENDYKKKIEAIKIQYDSNIKSIINEHNQGVKSIQSLHEETLQDIIKIHENEVENLRTMSIEAMRKADKLEKENQTLKTKITMGLDEEPVKMSSPESKRRKKNRTDTKILTKTDVEAFNVKPKTRSNGPCTCSLDVNISDTIRNIFEQVDIEQRKMAEHTYLKYIANKILNNNVETLDAQELSFLHLKVCRTWKLKLSKEDALQKRIGSLENELIHKQRHTQQHIAELDRKVAEERRRLQEVREAVCRRSSFSSRTASPESGSPNGPTETSSPEHRSLDCNCNPQAGTFDDSERRSAGDLTAAIAIANKRNKRNRPDNNRAALHKLDIDEHRDPKPYSDEPPTRLRRSYDRQSRSHKK